MTVGAAGHAGEVDGVRRVAPVDAWLLDYDTDEFWPTFFNHVDSVFLTELLTNADVPAALGDRLRSRTEEAVQRGTGLPATVPGPRRAVPSRLAAGKVLALAAGGTA